MNTIVVKDSCCQGLWAVVLDIKDTDLILQCLKLRQLWEKKDIYVTRSSTRHYLVEFICYLLLICCVVRTRLKLKIPFVLALAWELRR